MWKFTCGMVMFVALAASAPDNSAFAAAPVDSGYAERFKSAETALADNEQLYLVCDLAKSRLRLKLKGIVVRDYDYTLDGDSDQVISFRRRAEDADSVVHRLTRLHLYEAANKLNDTVLGIVSEATKASSELLQRYRPERLAVTFEGRLGLEVLSEVEGKPVSLGSNWAESAKEFAERVMGSKMLAIRLDPDDAMSFYGACQSKPPLLVAP